jgi:hypothetical protein
VIRKRLGRFAIVATSAALLGVMAASAPVSAAQPGWRFENLQYLPASVGDGQVAGYSFTIANRGRSNISQLFFTDSVNAAPVYFTATRPGCVTSPNLYCAFGALNSGHTIDVVIAYRVGTSDFSNTFRLDSTGDPAGGNNSHGDSKLLPVTTDVSTNSNFDGGFALGDATWQTSDASLGRQNKQATKAETTDALIPVTLEDGIASYPCTGCTTHLIGEWSVLNVNNGAVGDPIKVTIMIWGGSVPKGVDADEISLLHADGLGGSTEITAACNASPPTNADCIESITKVGKNFRIVAWLAKNGGLRGIY